jgi:hypothetical protein
VPGGLGFGGRHVADRAEQAAIVVPVHPVHRGDLYGREAAPWSGAAAGSRAAAGAGATGAPGVLGSVFAAVTLPLMLSGDTQQPQYVVRGGVATPDNLIAGTNPLPPQYGAPSGFSVQSAPGRTINELAAAGRFPNAQISYSTTDKLSRVGHPVLTGTPGRGLHATVVAPHPLSRADAERISAQFTVTQNPARCPR